MSLQLVLVEPAGPLNIGSIARLCANFDVAGLRLVAPRCDPFGEEARRMAVHGLDLLQRARLYPDLAAALADCRRVVACSGRAEGAPLPLQEPSRALPWLLAGEAAADQLAPAALVFGREDRGLSNDELLQAGRLLCIATGPAYSSLNLSHAVAVVLHELHGLRQGHCAGSPAPSLPSAATPQAAPCARAELEATLAAARELLLEAGFLLPHTAHARMAKLRALLQRAAIRSDEVALLRGMVRQLRWAQRHHAREGLDG